MNQSQTRLVALGIVVVLAGCGGGGRAALSTATLTASVDSSRATLLRAIRATIAANDRVSGLSLWTNIVPAAAVRSTGGPALSQLRAAAAQRRKQGVRIRTAAERRRIVSITLDPSYASAVAVVDARERLVPYRGNTRSGRAINLNERARIELRRVGRTSRFRVWKVSLIT
jgi:hypothetical protein